MPIVHADDAVAHDVGGTTFVPLVAPSRGTTEISVWRVQLPPGGDPVPHEVTREEVLVILSGVARASIAGEVTLVAAGGAVVVPPHTPFSLTAAGDEPVTALAYLPVGGQARLPGQPAFTPPWAQ